MYSKQFRKWFKELKRGKQPVIHKAEKHLKVTEDISPLFKYVDDNIKKMCERNGIPIKTNQEYLDDITKPYMDVHNFKVEKEDYEDDEILVRGCILKKQNQLIDFFIVKLEYIDHENVSLKLYDDQKAVV